MSLPSLDSQWDSSITGLHRASLVLGALRIAVQPHDKNWLELGLKPVPAGLSTDVLPAGGEVMIDFKRAALVYRPTTSTEHIIALEGESAESLLRQLLPHISHADLPAVHAQAEANSGDNLVAALQSVIRSKGHSLLTAPTPETTTPIAEIDMNTANAYADALYRVFTALARFRARLQGHMTPLVVFPEHFDLSTLWFVEGDMDDHKPHLNFGFAPFSPGLPRPYLYAYAYPYPADFAAPPLPAPARWHSEGWRGVVIDYDAISQHNDPEAAIERLCLHVFASLQSVF
jgi:hypothetical protein